MKKNEMIKQIEQASELFRKEHKDETTPIHLAMSEFQIAWLMETLVMKNINTIKAIKEQDIQGNLLIDAQLEIGMGDSLLQGLKYAIENHQKVSEQTNSEA